MLSQTIFSTLLLSLTPALAAPAPKSIALPGSGPGCVIGVRTTSGPVLGSATFNLTRPDGSFVWSDTAASPNLTSALSASTSTGLNNEVPLRITTFPSRVAGGAVPDEDSPGLPLVTYMQGSVVYESGHGPEDLIVGGCYVGAKRVDENGGEFRDTICELKVDNC